MTRHNECPAASTQRPFEPFDRFYIQMVGRLVEEEEVWISDDESRQGNSGLLSPRESRGGLSVSGGWEPETPKC